MRGSDHALTGAVAWLALTSSSEFAVGLHPVVPSVMAAGFVVAAGAAMLPDIDHPSASIAHSLPSLEVGGRTLIPSPTKLLAHLVETVSGGHRHGTHSLLGVAVFTGLTLVAGLVRFPVGDRDLPVLSGLIAAVLVAFAFKVWGVGAAIGGGRGGVVRYVVGAFMRSWAAGWVLAVGFAAGCTWFWGEGAWWWLPSAVLVGAAAHVAGDLLTVEGVPLLWPWHPPPPTRLRGLLRHVWGRNGYLRVPVLGAVGDTPKWRERVLGFVLMGYAAYLVAHEVTVHVLSGAVLLP